MGRYNILNVATFIINRNFNRIRNSVGMSYLRLMSILYYVQAKFLLETGEPCFDDDLIAESYGIKIEKIRETFGRWSGMTIPCIYQYNIHKVVGYMIKDEDFTYDNIPLEDRARIMSIVDLFKLYSLTDLNDIVKNQSPWKDARDTRDNIVTHESLVLYFGETTNNDV